MNKSLTKRLAETLGVTCPAQYPVPSAVEVLHFPCIVKPNREGSTVGMHIVRDKSELSAALADAEALDSTVLIEEYIEGTEVTVGVLCGEALPTLEIVPKSGFYDYASKYTKGMTDYICPARIDTTLAETLQKWSCQVFALLECRGVARADFMISKQGKPYFLEINTIPGMTETSLVPKAAAQMGLSYADVCERVLNDAHCEAVK